MKLLFGLNDVIGLDAWLDHFEQKGFEVDGAMSGEDLLAVSLEFKPDILVCEYKLKGELDGLGLYSELCSEPGLQNVKLILLADLKTEVLKRASKKVIDSSGILGVIRMGDLSFEAVEELL